MKRMLRVVLLGVGALALTGWSAHAWLKAADQPTAAKPSDKDVERARKEVKMLDDIYKNTIVLITDKYVNSPKDYPAGRAAVVLFRNISKGGSHEVRLLDVSGEPNNPKNLAADDFEEAGVKQLKDGKDYYEQLVQKDGKPYLRAVTAVPVVMDKCIMCHENYKKAKKGEAVGAISYTVPIE
ncbi:MAG TPA: DUF3365 domain-containing protein [Gemmataceae bacterium]|nr:DUF3365 domain-containing protein [Gemmataceae bacterium]